MFLSYRFERQEANAQLRWLPRMRKPRSYIFPLDECEYAGIPELQKEKRTEDHYCHPRPPHNLELHSQYGTRTWSCRAHRFEIIETLAGHFPLLRAQQTLLLEHKRGADEHPRTNGQNNSNPVQRKISTSFDVSPIVVVVTYGRYSDGCVELELPAMVQRKGGREDGLWSLGELTVGWASTNGWGDG